MILDLSDPITAMDSVAVLRSFQYAVSTSFSLEKPGVVSIKNSSFSSPSKLPIFVGNHNLSANRHRAVSLSCAKTPEATITAKYNSELFPGELKFLNGAALSDSQSEESREKKSSFKATFPKGLKGLLTEICKTEIAEVKVKLGDFEMNMKRNTDGPTVSEPLVPSIQQNPILTTPPDPPKPSAETTSPFKNVSQKSYILEALEASGSAGYVVVSSPLVGSFIRARTLRGKLQKPACKEGDMIKEGQVVGYVSQFGHELAVRSDVAGEVVKILFSNGEPVGYGEPLVAILPSLQDHIGVQ